MDGSRSIHRIADVLKEIAADIICLQEVHQRLPWSGFQNQPARLSRLLGKPVIFQANYRFGIGQFGNALLTSLPVLKQASIRLPNRVERSSILRKPERRGLLEVTLKTESGPVTILLTHWSLAAPDRMESASVTADRVKKLSLPIVLAGDFNGIPGSPEIEALQTRSGLRDAGREDGKLTFPAEQPDRRIDYVWHSNDMWLASTRIIETAASDHYAVVVDFHPLTTGSAP